MKKIITTVLPALSLLALGGCAGTSGLATSDNDGVYYSAGNRAPAVAASQPAAPGYNAPATDYTNTNAAPAYNEPTAIAEPVNPDYTGNASGAAVSNSSAQYYDDSYTANGYNRSAFNTPYTGPGVPYTGPSVAYYAPVAYAPYTSLGYGWGGGYCGFSPYGVCDPFYSPFYSPYGYGYGSGLSVSIGFGRPWGGYGYGRPYYGGFYDPFYGPVGYGGYYSSYYGGYGGYYGGGYGYRRNVVYPRGGNAYYGTDRTGPTVQVGPRGGRGGNVMVGGRPAGPAPVAGTSAPVGGRRLNMDSGRPAPTGGIGQPTTGGRSSMPNTMAGTAANAPEAISGSQPTGRSRYRNNFEQPAGTQPLTPAGNTGSPSQPERYSNQPVEMNRRGGRWRNLDATPAAGSQMATPAQPAAQPDYQQPRRNRFFSDGGSGQPMQQQQPSRMRSFEQPQQSERPSYSAPQRTSQPSFGGGGGGSMGGGGGGGRRGGRW